MIFLDFDTDVFPSSDTVQQLWQQPNWGCIISSWEVKQGTVKKESYFYRQTSFVCGL